MRPLLIAWLARHGLPGWLAPDYFQLASIATLVGSALALHLAARDGASRRHTAYAIAAAYVGALVTEGRVVTRCWRWSEARGPAAGTGTGTREVA